MGRPACAWLVWLLVWGLAPAVTGRDAVEEQLAEALRAMGDASLQSLLPLSPSERDAKYSSDVLEILQEVEAQNREAYRPPEAAPLDVPSAEAAAERLADTAVKGARAEAAYLEAVAGELRQRLGEARLVAVENMYLKARLEAALNQLTKTQTALDLCGDAQAEISRLQDAVRDQGARLEEQALVLARARLDHAGEQRRQQAHCHESLLTQAAMYGQLELTVKDMLHHDDLMTRLVPRSADLLKAQPQRQEVVVHERASGAEECVSDGWGFFRFTRRAEALRQYYERELGQRDATIRQLRRDCRGGSAPTAANEAMYYKAMAYKDTSPEAEGCQSLRQQLFLRDQSVASLERQVKELQGEAAEYQRQGYLLQGKHSEARALRGQHADQLQLRDEQLFDLRQQQERSQWERDRDAKEWQARHYATALEKEAVLHRDYKQQLFSRDHTIASLERTIQGKDDQLRAMQDGEGMCRQLQLEADRRLDRCHAQVAEREDRIFGLEREAQQRAVQREAAANEAQRLRTEAHVAQHQIQELQWALARERGELSSIQTRLLEFETMQQQGMIYRQHATTEKQQSRQLMDRVLELDAYVRRLELEREDWQARRGDEGTAAMAQCHAMLEEVTHWRRQCEVDLAQSRRASADGLWQALPAPAHHPDDAEALRQELLMTRKRLADAQTLCGEPRKVLQVRERDYGKSREVLEARGREQDMESRYRRLLEEQRYGAPAACDCNATASSPGPAPHPLERSTEVQACHREHLRAQDIYEEYRVTQTYQRMALQEELDAAVRRAEGALAERTRLLGDLERLRSWETSGVTQLEEQLQRCAAQVAEYGGTFVVDSPGSGANAASGWWPFGRKAAEPPATATSTAKAPAEPAPPCKRSWFGWGACKPEPPSTEGCTRGWFGRLHCPPRDTAAAGECVVVPPGRNWFGWVPLVRALTARRPSCQPPCVEDTSGRGWLSFLRRKPPFKCVMPEGAAAAPAPTEGPAAATPTAAGGPGLVSHVTTVLKGVVYVLVLFYVCRLIVQSRSPQSTILEAPASRPVSVPGSSTAGSSTMANPRRGHTRGASRVD